MMHYAQFRLCEQWKLILNFSTLTYSILSVITVGITVITDRILNT